jgi:uncharacterized protein YjbI with pentapeptide repeats
MVVWQVPPWQARQTGLDETNEAYPTSVESRRPAWLQLSGIALVSFGHYVGRRGFRAGRQRRLTRTLAKARQGLESSRLDKRLATISALGRVANRGAEAHWQVAEVLVAFVRERNQGAFTEGENAAHEVTTAREEFHWATAPDVQLAVQVLVGRNWRERDEDSPVSDLAGCNLSRMGLSGAHLEDAILRGACLVAAELWRAHLDGADLSGAHLEGASLAEASLDGANLSDAHLGGADLQYASLRRAELTRADLTGVRLTLAHIEGARLADATGLTLQQLESAYKDPATELPKHLN